MNIRTITRLAVLPVAGAATLALAGPAAAHVTVSPTETAAGSYTVLTFSVGHGCDGSPTTEIAIQMPDGIYAASPTRQPFYDVEKVMAELDEPITDAHGNELTERVDQVVYTATTPLPEGQRDAFELSVKLPDDAIGDTLFFPAVQTCEEGETAWTEIPADGQSGDELESPAPGFEVTDADAEAEGSAGGAAAGDTIPVDVEDQAGEEPDEGTDPLAVGGLVAGLLGLALGATALLRTRGRGRA